MIDNPRALIATLGGTTEPLVATIAEHLPTYVCFVASEESARQVDGIRQSLRDRGVEMPPSHVEVVDDIEDLTGAYDAADRAIHQVISHAYSADEIVVDFTGGTKTMSAAVVLAAVTRGCAFSYVGGGRRNREGLGTVESGTERVRHSLNPWEIYAVEDLRSFSRLFDGHQYAAARDIADDLARRPGLGSNLHGAARLLAALANAYDLWDGFDQAGALDAFNAVLSGPLELEHRVEMAPFDMKPLIQAARGDRDFLEAVEDETDRFQRPSTGLVSDLLGNAQRRARSGRYDDAILRLYRAFEMIGQIAFEETFGCPTARIDHEVLGRRIPPERRKDIRTDLSNFGLGHVFDHLALADAYLGRLYASKRREVRDLMARRNESCLAHGISPLGVKDYESLVGVVTEFAEATQCVDPIRFPLLAWHGGSEGPSETES